ncbi:MAG: RNA polymerase sigma factor [bacterium]
MLIDKSQIEIDAGALALKSKAGDLKSFEDLVNMHRQFAFKVAFKILFNENDAREAAHECFIKIWKNLKNYKTEMKFTTWMYKIVVNICYDKLKTEKRKKSIMQQIPEDESNFILDRSCGIEEYFSNNEIAGLIKKYATTLPEKQRMVFALRDLEGLSVNEVSQILKMSLGSVKTNPLFARRAIAAKIRKLENFEVLKNEL